jgi:hypothetical protein
MRNEKETKTEIDGNPGPKRPEGVGNRQSPRPGINRMEKRRN